MGRGYGAPRQTKILSILQNVATERTLHERANIYCFTNIIMFYKRFDSFHQNVQHYYY